MTKTIAVMVGSLRKDSINRKYAQVLENLAQGKMKFNHIQLDDLPFYNEDLWADPPAAVIRLKKQIDEADGVLVISPEYNRSYPALLKNAFDWGSRPPSSSCWPGKPVAITGTSEGKIGTAVGQTHLRLDMLNLGTVVMTRPEAYLQWLPDVFPEGGGIANEGTQKFLQHFIDNFAKWIEAHG